MEDSQAQLLALYGQIDSLKSFRSNALTLGGVAAFALGIWLLGSFKSWEVSVDPSDGTVYAVRCTWWGLSRRDIPIRWMRAPGYREPGWMAKSEKGKWYVLFPDEDILADIPSDRDRPVPP